MQKPTIAEITSYMIEREFYQLDEAEAFFDHFESNGWHVGKTKMKDWKAAVRTWIRNHRKWSKRNEESRRNNQTFADRQRQAAADAYAEMERANGQVGLRLVRSSG